MAASNENSLWALCYNFRAATVVLQSKVRSCVQRLYQQGWFFKKQITNLWLLKTIALFLFVATCGRMFSEFKRALDGQQWFARTSSSE